MGSHILKRCGSNESKAGQLPRTEQAFIDWVNPHLEDEDRKNLGKTADKTIARVKENWALLRDREVDADDQAYALGWLGTADYLKLAERSLTRLVIKPLRERGIPVSD